MYYVKQTHNGRSYLSVRKIHLPKLTGFLPPWDEKTKTRRVNFSLVSNNQHRQYFTWASNSISNFPKPAHCAEKAKFFLCLINRNAMKTYGKVK